MIDPRTLSAADVMTADVLTLEEDTPIEEALGLFEDYEVSGAPVLNAAGECVGVFSLADVARRESEIDEGTTPFAAGYFNFNPLGESLYLSKESYDDVEFERETVGDWMSRDLKVVAPDASVRDVARLMLRERVHRVLVMEGKELRGIVSSLDLVAVMAGEERPGRARPRAAKPAARRKAATRRPAAKARVRRASGRTRSTKRAR
jgi:CBS domain-containing protein